MEQKNVTKKKWINQFRNADDDKINDFGFFFASSHKRNMNINVFCIG